MGGAPRWLGVEMRHFAALKEVAETGSFSRAASRLGYTQSAISQQVAALERSMGSRLLERPNGTQKVTLTRAGARLLEHAEEIVARMSAAAADLDGLSDEQVVRVGIFQSVAVNLLPRILAELSGRAPEVEVELDERTVDADLLAAVERGDLDLTFGMLPLANGPFEPVELLHDPYVVVALADSADAGSSRATSCNRTTTRRSRRSWPAGRASRSCRD